MRKQKRDSTEMKAMILAIVLCFGHIPLFADAGAATILILPFENATGNQNYTALEKGFPDLLIAYLAPQSGIQVVEREKLDQVMSEQGLKWENVMENQGASKAAHFAQAKYLLRGSLRGTKEDMEVQANLYETETTRLLKAFSSRGPKSMSAHAQAIAAGVAQFFSVPVPVMPALPSDADPETSLHRIQGLGYYHTGQYNKAFPEFMKILSKRPKDPDAKYWLGKSFWGAGLKGQASIEFQQFMQWFPKDSRVSEVKELGGQKP